MIRNCNDYLSLYLESHFFYTPCISQAYFLHTGGKGPHEAHVYAILMVLNLSSPNYMD